MVKSEELRLLAQQVKTHIKHRELEMSNVILANQLSAKYNKKDSIVIECSISPVLEMSEGFQLPLPVRLDLIEEGMFHDVFLPAEELVQVPPTFFYKDESIEHNIIHIDHKNQFKEKPSVSTRIGKLTDVIVENNKTGKLVAYGLITNGDYARAIYYGVSNKISVRIIPMKVRYEFGRKVGRNLIGQEVSLVVDGEYKKSNIEPTTT